VENRRRVREKLRLPAEPIWLEQVHGVGVVELGAAGVSAPDAARGWVPSARWGDRARRHCGRNRRNGVAGWPRELRVPLA